MPDDAPSLLPFFGLMTRPGHFLEMFLVGLAESFVEADACDGIGSALCQDPLDGGGSLEMLVGIVHDS